MRRLLSRSVLMGAMLVVAIVASACATLPPVMGGTPAAAVGTGGPATDATVTPPAPVSGNSAINEVARQTLAEQLGINVETVTVVSVSQVEWPNGCLGIQKPGMMCTDAIVPGYQVILEANGKQYEVRTDMTGRAVAVAPEGSSAPAGEYPAAAQLARGKAAADLGTELSQVQITAVEKTEWPDACLGMPDPTELCAQMITPGYRVTLDANGQQVVYRTDETGKNIRAERQPQAPQTFPPAAQAAREALAKELGVPLESVTIQRAEPTEFTDSCLGLGGPAESCLRAATPGYTVTLEVNGEQYIYHTDQTGENVRRAQTSAAPGQNPPAAQAASAALAQELGIPVETITVVSATATEFTDSCLGLGGPAESCLQAVTPGYIITLETSGQQYVYHTDESGQNVRQAQAVAGSAGSRLPHRMP